MSEQVEQLSMLSAEDSPVSLSPWLESKKVKGMTVISGRKCSELSPNLRRVGLSVRTYLESCELPLPTLYRTWSVSAITSACLNLRLRLSVRSTGGTGSRLWPTARAGKTTDENEETWLKMNAEGKVATPPLTLAVKMLWATPNTMDSLPSRSYEAMKRQATVGGRKNRQRPGNLREQIDPLMCQAYVDASIEANAPKMWPTPTTGAGLCGGTGNFQQLHKMAQEGTITEYERRQMSQGNGGQLNPMWVELLMGYPKNWTEL